MTLEMSPMTTPSNSRVPSLRPAPESGSVPARAARDAAATLAAASMSDNTRRAYTGALRRLEAWLDGTPLTDNSLAVYLGSLFEAGRSPATASMIVAAVRAQYRLSGEPSPVGEATARVLAGFRRTGAERSRGPATGVQWGQADAAAAVAANGSKSNHGLRDGAIVAVGSAAMLRVSELSALRWSDIEADGDHTITLRRSKTDQEGAGVTLYIGEPTVARLEAWHEALGGIGGDTGPDAPVFVRLHKGGQRAGSEPISATALRAIIARRCANAGVEGRVSGHSLRIGAAQDLAAAGASLVEMQQAGRWLSPTMPARYARGQLATRGAVARLRFGQ